MKKLIVLIGKQNSGKTTTLNKFIEVLSARFNRNHLTVKVQRKAEELGDIDNHGFDKSHVIFLNGHYIGVCTAGDKAYYLDMYGKPLKDCDIVFCAAHNKSMVEESKFIKEFGFQITREIYKSKFDGQFALDQLLSELINEVGEFHETN